MDRGEIVCLVGESGSGKSVIAHAVMGLLPKGLAATTGEIRLTGENLLKAGASRLRELRCTRMSMIFQEPMTALNPVMRCGEQVDEVLATHTSLPPNARRERTLDIVRAVQLADPERMLASYPHQLSGGQRQRIMIAMALVLEPALLIADEPTTALDVTTQAQILALIRRAAARSWHGRPVHHARLRRGRGDRRPRCGIARGRVVEAGGPRELLTAPKHAYTRMLIDAVPSLAPRHRECRHRARRAADHGALQDLCGSRLVRSGTTCRCRRGRCVARDAPGRDARAS